MAVCSTAAKLGGLGCPGVQLGHNCWVRAHQWDRINPTSSVFFCSAGQTGVCRGECGGKGVREAGARVLLTQQALDGRRLEVVAEGLLLFGGMQLRCDGTSRPGAAHIGGVALQVARRRVQRTHHELVGSAPGPDWSSSEVGGRLSCAHPS